MLLFGMMNWMFTWLQPDGELSHDDLAPVVADLFFGGLGAVRAPSRRRSPFRPRAPRRRAMSDPSVLQSLIADRWIGSRPGAPLASAIDGATIRHAHADEIDFAEALALRPRAPAGRPCWRSTSSSARRA